MNKANHIFFAFCLSLALFTSCTTELAELPSPPSSDSNGGFSESSSSSEISSSSSLIEAQSSSSNLAYSSSSSLEPSSSSAPAVSSSSFVSLSSSSSLPSGEVYCLLPNGDCTIYAPEACVILSGTSLSSCPASSSSVTPSSSSAIPSSSSVLPSSGSGGGSSGTFTDGRDSQTYKWVLIGDQIWMAENLNYDASGSVCYSNSASNCDTYGRLYNWATAMDDVCPSGWHLPSNAEWDKLVNFAGGTNNIGGTKLKATSGWDNSGNGTDEFGFSALPGGRGESGGSFGSVGYDGNWWTATENHAFLAFSRLMLSGSGYVSSNNEDKSRLFSVRCLQD